ncbi:MAG: hypothetical protein IJE09_04225 [Oscillospiraceae bacterium]|nr:hypothetical protein [Oscillospiraceae bacterium]
MRNGKHVAKRSYTKMLVTALALVLVCCMAVGGTLAWLQDKTNTVTNTFTAAELFENPDADFGLWEHEVVDADKDGKYEFAEATTTEGVEYNILPGVNIPKDPTVDVKNLKANAYLFIKVDDTLEFGLNYEVDSCWKAIDADNGVYVYLDNGSEIINASSEGKSFTANILKDKQIVVDGNYVSIGNPGALSFTAYMVQATGNGSSAAEAWANTYGADLGPSAPPTTP